MDGMNNAILGNTITSAGDDGIFLDSDAQGKNVVNNNITNAANGGSLEGTNNVDREQYGLIEFYLLREHTYDNRYRRRGPGGDHRRGVPCPKTKGEEARSTHP